MPECKVLQAEATYFAWIDLRALDIRPAQLTYLLEQETQIVVENGFRLGKGGAGFIRFNLATFPGKSAGRNKTSDRVLQASL